MKLPLVSCDPGTKGLGLAVWSGGELVRAGFETFDGPRDAVLGVTDFTGNHYFDLAIEVPQVYVAGKSKGNPNDLIDVALVVGALIGAACASHHFVPRVWKGQTPKEITTRRSREKLSEAELARIVMPRGSLRHNVWDAIGIGLFSLRR